MKDKYIVVSSQSSFGDIPTVDFDIEIGDKLYQIEIADFTKDRDDYLAELNSDTPKKDSKFFALADDDDFIPKQLKKCTNLSHITVSEFKRYYDF